MNSRRASRFREGALAARSFTLVEILVAVAVLVILMALLGKIMATASMTWSAGKRRADDFVKARSALDTLSRDYQMGVFHAGLPSFAMAGGAFTNAFYSLRQSSGTAGERALSLVSYQIRSTSTNSTLQRMTAPVPWSALPPFGQDGLSASAFADAQDMVDGILRLEISFVRPDGSLTNAYTAGDSAVGIDLVVLDDATLALLARAGKLSALLASDAFSLPGGLSVTNSPHQVWQANITRAPNASHPLDYPAYPADLRTGIRSFQRYVPLP